MEVGESVSCGGGRDVDVVIRCWQLCCVVEGLAVAGVWFVAACGVQLVAHACGLGGVWLEVWDGESCGGVFCSGCSAGLWLGVWAWGCSRGVQLVAHACGESCRVVGCRGGCVGRQLWGVLGCGWRVMIWQDMLLWSVESGRGVVCVPVCVCGSGWRGGCVGRQLWRVCSCSCAGRVFVFV